MIWGGSVGGIITERSSVSFWDFRDTQPSRTVLWLAGTAQGIKLQETNETDIAFAMCRASCRHPRECRSRQVATLAVDSTDLAVGYDVSTYLGGTFFAEARWLHECAI
jgi:hypothetical protein